MAEPKLVDLAYTKAEMKEEAKEYAVPGEPSPYPWGLCITLEGNELDKLGIKDLPGVGDEFHLMVIATVTSVNQSARAQQEERRVGMQITEIGVMAHESAAEEEAEGEETPAKEQAENKSLMAKYRS